MSSSEQIQAIVRQTLEASELGGYEPADALRDTFTGIMQYLKMPVCTDEVQYNALSHLRRILLTEVLRAAEGIIDDITEDLC